MTLLSSRAPGKIQFWRLGNSQALQTRLLANRSIGYSVLMAPAATSTFHLMTRLIGGCA